VEYLSESGGKNEHHFSSKNDIKKVFLLNIKSS
jgi:hypothetical protein